MISTIHNFSNNNTTENNCIKNNNVDLPLIITYNLYGNRKPLNNWDNPNLFLITFFAFFLNRDGGYIRPQSIKITLYI